MKTASREGDYFHRALAVDNTNSAAYPEIMALGVLLRAGPGEEDVVMTKTGRLYMPEQTGTGSEVFFTITNDAPIRAYRTGVRLP